MSPIAAPRQSQSGLNGEKAGISTSLLEDQKTGCLKRLKNLTAIFDSKKKSSPPLRQTSLAIDIDTANRVPGGQDIDDLTDSDFTQSLYYSPELAAAIVSSGGRPKRWAFCSTPTPGRDNRDKGEGTERTEEEEGRRPTLYLILDPDQDPSRPSEVLMLVGTKEELGGKTGGGDELGKGAVIVHSKGCFCRRLAITGERAQTVPKGDASDCAGEE